MDHVFSWRGTYTSHVIYHVPRVKWPRVEYPYSGHTRNSHTWNTCRHKRAVNICYSQAINLQKHVEFSPQLLTIVDLAVVYPSCTSINRVETK